VSTVFDENWVGDNSLEPSRNMGHSLSESTIEDSLVSSDEGVGANDISRGDMSGGKEFSVLEVVVNNLNMGLEVLDIV